MSDTTSPAREEADKIMRMLANKDASFVYTVIMYVTISLFVHDAKERALKDTRVSWPDWLRTVANNYQKQLMRQTNATAKANDEVLSSNIIALPAERKIIQ